MNFDEKSADVGWKLYFDAFRQSSCFEEWSERDVVIEVRRRASASANAGCVLRRFERRPVRRAGTMHSRSLQLA